jgi:hypothetical protein
MKTETYYTVSPFNITNQGGFYEATVSTHSTESEALNKARKLRDTDEYCFVEVREIVTTGGKNETRLIKKLRNRN